MFTPLVGGTLTFIICTLLTVLYIPVLFIFYRRSEFHSVLAYRMMFWIGVADVGQLIILSLSGILAMTQSSSFPFYINKFCGSTLYALWFAMLFLSIVITLNRFVSIVFSSYYSTIFDRLNVNVCFSLTNSSSIQYSTSKNINTY
ncbi:hypothetical protein ANCCAN_20403 [Ancylostoma caninum]|uniref:G-protein coupled receptors family 1 profile domain-containing protein n=1 Tax=Ancylostoma caninum TaxID=29170 RepID=A0A368FRV8_ANCCA|nr:hypothetical protein ANCCAN_20403 [Ancylostoma caninum]